jgi:hypothetical protein
MELWPLVPPGGATALVRLAPDGKRLGFVRTDGEAAGLYVCAATPRPSLAARPAASADDAARLVGAPGGWFRELDWSPDGEYLAFLLALEPGSGGAVVGWCSSRRPGELGRISGASFAWTRASTGLIVTATDVGHVVHRPIAEDRARPLAVLEHDSDPRFPPRLAVSQHEPAIAFSSRSLLHGISELHLAERHGADFVTRVLTEIPGADAHVFPFWAPGAPHLAFFVVHEEYRKSAIIAVPRLRGDGVVLYQREGLDAPQCPAWSPSGKAIALLGAGVAASPGPETATGHDLVIVDCRDRTASTIPKTGKLSGRLAFAAEHRLLVEGDSHVRVVDLPMTS